MVTFISAIFAFFGLISVLITWLIIRVIWKSLRKRSPKELADLRRKAEEYVNEKRSELGTWNAHRADTLSLSLSFFALKSTTRTLKGTMTALNGEPLIAFCRKEYGMGATGFVCAASTDFEYFIETTPDGIYTIHRNGAYMGQWDMGQGAITNASGKVMGSAVHPPLQSFTFIAGRKKKYFGSMPKYYGGTAYTYREGKPVFSVMLNGTEVAEMRVAPGRTMEIKNYDREYSEENPEGIQLLQYKIDPSEGEEQWLVTLCIIEAIVHGHWLV